MYRFVVQLILLSILTGCSLIPLTNPPYRGPFPYRFRVQKREIPSTLQFIDLNNDGFDEAVSIPLFPHYKINRLILYNQELELIDQANLPAAPTYVDFFDWNGDGDLEIAAFYPKNNQMRIRIISIHGDVLKDTVLYSGKPRVEENVIYDWQGNIYATMYQDVDRKPPPELVVFPSEGYARSPRGIFLFHGKTLQRIWKLEIGPALSRMITIADLDKDGRDEFILPTSSPNNGSVASNLNDWHAYLLMVEDNGTIAWVRVLGDKFCNVYAYYGDIDADGTDEILAISTRNMPARSIPSMWLVDPLTGKDKTVARKFPYPMNDFYVGQLDRDAMLEVVIASPNGNLYLLDHTFTITKSIELESTPGMILESPDLTNDGLVELFVRTTNGTYLIDPQLRILAQSNLFVKGYLRKKVAQLHHGTDGLRYVYFFDKDKIGHLAYLEKNSVYLLEKYGPLTGIFLTVLLLAGGAFQIRRVRNQMGWRKYAIQRAISILPHPVLLLDSKKRIAYSNGPARRIFQLPDTQSGIKSTALRQFSPQLVDFINTLYSIPTERKAWIQIDSLGTDPVLAFAEPIDPKESSWAIWIRSGQSPAEKQSGVLFHGLRVLADEIARIRKRMDRRALSRRATIRVLLYFEKLENSILQSLNKLLGNGPLTPETTDPAAILKNLIAVFEQIYPDTDILPRFDESCIQLNSDREVLEILLFSVFLRTAAYGAVRKLHIEMGQLKKATLTGSKDPEDFILIEFMASGDVETEKTGSDLSQEPFGEFIRSLAEIIDIHIEENLEKKTGLVFSVYIPLKLHS